MGELKVEVDPAEVGMDAGRLARLDAHFRGYVDDGRLPGWLIAVARHGQLVHVSTYGHRDVEDDLPVEHDTVFRIFSMTKPVTSVAAMMLAEEGAFELKDPVSRFLPAFADQRVYRSGGLQPETEPVGDPMRIWHLLTHTSGLTYGFHHAHAVDEQYRNAGFELGSPPGLDTAGCVAAWAGIPLLFQPGTEWNYGVSTDVLGHLVEVVSGQRLDDFFAERIFEPLGMHETAFHLAADQHDRKASLYVANPADGLRLKFDALSPIPTEPPPFLSGGGGLVSTAADYLRFADMLRRGGELDGARLLGSRTVAYMRQNHLPGGADLEAFGRPLFSETTFTGVGFGLGFSVAVDPVALKVPSSAGEFGWGGAASTFFSIDPVEDTVALFLTQLLPSSAHPIRSNLRALVHQSLVD
jgi:CubicO group peptidase (beta-lactamase class C family)